MNIYKAGFFGLMGIAFVTAIKLFIFGSFGNTLRASDYILEVDVSELKQAVVRTIAEQKTFADEFSKLAYTVDVPTVIATKCRTFKPSQVSDCEYRLRKIFEVITIEDTYPGWRGVCERFHVNALDVYDCILNFRRNSGWTQSSLITLKENARIEECFRNVPKAKYSQCINPMDHITTTL